MKLYLYFILNIYLAFSLLVDNPNILEEDIILLYEGYSPIKDSIELEDYIITKISWTKAEDYKYNYLFGIFEISNETSFMDSLPLGMILEKEGEFNEENNIEIKSQIPFKYIKYVPPNKNNSDISPIKIYGYKRTPYDSQKQNEKEEQVFQLTNLPLILIHTENLIEPEVKGWSSDSEDINCKVKIINKGKIELNEDAEIKIRGRSTSFIPPKKPYRIKFSSKQKVLNFKGKEKKWTLIANYFDRSLLRNNLAFKISQLMEFKYTPRCTPVDVILNGNFRGNYYLCDKIEVGKNRINITKMEPTDNTEPNITGGYLLQIDSLRGSSQDPTGFRADKGLVGKILYPEDDELTIEQKNYITYRINKLEDEVYNGILDSLDLDSYSKYFLIEEFCADIDHVFSSYYFTKDRNDDKFYFGPAWDFDLGLDNDRRLIPTNNKSEFSFNYGDSAGTMREFVKALIGNKEVISYIQKIWQRLRETSLNEKILADYLEEQKAIIQESSELNFLKWDHFEENNQRRGMSFGRKGENFDVSVEVVKDYIINRLESLTNLINKAVLLAK